MNETERSRERVDSWIKSTAIIAVVALLCTTAIILTVLPRFSKLDDAVAASNAAHDTTVCLLKLAKDRQLPAEQRKAITAKVLKDDCKLSDSEITEVLRD